VAFPHGIGFCVLVFGTEGWGSCSKVEVPPARDNNRGNNPTVAWLVILRAPLLEEGECGLTVKPNKIASDTLAM
jgi:hypothetical protein